MTITFHAFKWSFLSELAGKILQPLVFIVLARLLTPEDFGVMTAAMMLVALSQVVIDAGLGKAIIRQQENIDIAANSAFWINILLGFLVASLVYLTANIVAIDLFKDQRVALVLKVMDAQILLCAFCTVQTAIIQKDFGFKKLFYARTTSALLSGIISILLALFGWGYWALVVGALAGQLLQTGIIWLQCYWKPKFEIDFAISREIVTFGFWVCVTGLSSWVFQWIDTLILGAFLGVVDVGLFRVGNQVATTIFNIAFAFLLPAMYVNFSHDASKNIGKIVVALNRGFVVIATISLPLGLAVYLVSNDIQVMLLGEKWNGVGFVIGFIALKEAALWVFALNIEAIRAIGKAKVETGVAIASGISNVIVLYIAVHYGFDAFIYSRSIILMVIGLFIHISTYLFVFGRENKSYKHLLVNIGIYFLLIILTNVAEAFGVSNSLLILVPIFYFLASIVVNYPMLKNTYELLRG